jgi:glycerophosphoryl diester phosphodiesterase
MKNLFKLSHLMLFFLIGPRTAEASGRLQEVQSCLMDSKCQKLIVAAHRQGFRRTIENSLAAIYWHYGKDTDMLEMDVRTTKDGHLVLSHNDRIDYRTEGRGSIADMTLSDLQKHKIKGLSEPIPTLADIAHAVKDRFFIMIDVKNASIAALWKLIKAKEIEKQTIIFVNESHEYREINRLLKSGEKPLFMPRLLSGWFEYSVTRLIDYFVTPPKFIHIDDDAIKREVLSVIHKRGLHAYMHFPKGKSADEIRKSGDRLRALGIHFFDSDQIRDIYDTLADWR